MLNMCRLQSLENFPKIDSLRRVDLAENYLKGEELKHLVQNENLEVLRLGKNKIATMDEVKILADLKKLNNLDLVENPVCSTDEYKRDAVFEMISSLEVLDYIYKDGKEYESLDDDEEEFMDGFEGGEDELEELRGQLSDKMKAKLEEKGISLEEYLMGMGEDLEEEEEEEDEGADKEAKADWSLMITHTHTYTHSKTKALRWFSALLESLYSKRDVIKRASTKHIARYPQSNNWCMWKLRALCLKCALL